MSNALSVNMDGFSYAGEYLYVETSGAHRHRRATLLEIREIFQPKFAAESFNDPVGHWYEAQLLHYGLSPSKSKAVAKTRLLDAMNRGSLVVPKWIESIETELKKQWSNKEREARAGLSKEKEREESSASVGGSGEMRGNVSININVGTSKVTFQSDAGASPAAKRARTTPAHSTVDQTNLSSRGSQMPMQTARRGGAAFSATKRALSSPNRPAVDDSSEISRVSQMQMHAARRGGIRSWGGRSSQGVSTAQGRGSTLREEHQSIPPKHEPDIKRESTNPSSARSFDPIPNYWESEADEYKVVPQRRLGLLNGRYEISCPELEQWEQFDGYEFSLILTLDGDAIWGAYDFGMFSGIFYLPQRPWEASHAELEFKWRGRENSEGMMSFGDQQVGWIRFLGDGEIDGVITVYGEAKFAGMRVSGAETRSERDARSMRQEWDGYNAWEYERENESRWGSGRW